MSEITNDIERYGRLLERDPGSRVFAPLAEAYRKANRLQEALEIAAAGVARHPTYASGRVALARAQLSLEQYEAATAELEQAISHAPENALAYRLLGEARRGLGDGAGAFDAFARALALNPEDGEAREAMAVLESDAFPVTAPGDLPAEGPPPEEGGAPLNDTLETSAPEPPEVVDAGITEEEISGPAAVSELDLALEPFGEERAAEETGMPEAGEEEAAPPGEATADPPEHPLEALDISQSSLAPEARESLPAEAGLREPSGEAEESGDIPVLEKEELTDAALEALEIIPLDTRVEDLADRYLKQGRVDRARALYRALLDGNPSNLEARKKLADLGPEPNAPSDSSPAGDRVVRRKVEENIEILNRWLANIRKGAAR